jgi:hypothetical protein
MTPEAAVAASRAVLGTEPAVRAVAQRVARLDRSGESYHLVILGDEDHTVGIAPSGDTGAVMATARRRAPPAPRG